VEIEGTRCSVYVEIKDKRGTQQDKESGMFNSYTKKCFPKLQSLCGGGVGFLSKRVTCSHKPQSNKREMVVVSISLLVWLMYSRSIWILLFHGWPHRTL